MERDAARDPLRDALLLDAAEAGEAVGEAVLLAAERGEGRALVVVEGGEARVEDEPRAGGVGVEAEERVLAAVALVEADVERAGDRHAVGGDERDVPRLAARQVRRLDLEVGDPAPLRPCGANVRAQPMTAFGNSPTARASPTPQSSAGTASESRKTTVSPSRPARPRLRAPPAWRRVLAADDRGAVALGEGGGAVGRDVVDDDRLRRRRLLAGEGLEDGSQGSLGVERRDDDRVAAGRTVSAAASDSSRGWRWPRSRAAVSGTRRSSCRTNAAPEGGVAGAVLVAGGRRGCATASSAARGWGGGPRRRRRGVARAAGSYQTV